MHTIKSTRDSVISRDAFRGSSALQATHSDRSKDPDTHSEMLADPLNLPSERPGMIADRSEADTEIRETLSGSKTASASPSKILSGSETASVSPSKVLEGSKAASTSQPKILSRSKTASASPSRIPSNPEKASARSPAVFPDPEKASASSQAVLTDPKKASPRSPAVFTDPKKASAVAPAVAGLSLKPSANRFEHWHQSPEPSGDAFEQAYQSLLPAMRALRRSQVLRINVGIPDAVAKALRIPPTLAVLMARIAQVAPGVDPGLPEQLATHALALGHAHALFLTTSRGVDELPSLYKEGRKLRAILLADAQSLIRRGLLDAGAVRGLRQDRGYQTLSSDLQILVEVFRPCVASGLRPANAADLARALELAVAILRLLGRRGMLRADIQTAADLRRRAFTLFTRIYSETRRVVTFLRWQEGDADEIVPLLHERRRNPNKREVPNTIQEAQ